MAKLLFTENSQMDSKDNEGRRLEDTEPKALLPPELQVKGFETPKAQTTKLTNVQNPPFANTPDAPFAERLN
jgi:hypothetical protein